MFIERMDGQDYIDQTRAYLDYLEQHLSNIAKAFQELSEACDGMAWVGDDWSWHTIRKEVEQHDLSKFSKLEFTTYRKKFFPVEGESFSEHDWDIAWHNHQKCNPHHHQSIRYDAGMPGLTEHDLVHMVVDWTAMSYEFGGTAESYYLANQSTIPIHEEFKPFLQELFDRLRRYNGH